MCVVWIVVSKYFDGLNYKFKTKDFKNMKKHLLSNMVTDASGLSFMASMNINGRNLVSIIRTFGPTNLSAIILPSRAAVCSRTIGLVELQNRFSRYINAPKRMMDVVMSVKKV